MDLSFNGPDATSQNSPYTFWRDNNFDRLATDAFDGVQYDDDVSSASSDAICSYTGVSTPDCNYLDGAGHRVIPCVRDVQDFTRLWVCGITSNLLAALPAGSTITLNWGDVGSPNSGNPTIDLFTAVDADGGMGYLTNSTTALIQTDPVSCPYIGRLGPGSNLQLNASQFNGWAGNHFIWCGVTNGSGQLTMTIADGSGNILGQASAWIQIKDIKDMYERWTVGDNPKLAPMNTATNAANDLPDPTQPPFQYALNTDTSTPYILLVHGWNVETWIKDRFAETTFKRLYWQGYQGRFGSFRWPTDYGITSVSSALVQRRNYDSSEFNAWRSGIGLLYKLTDLYNEYRGHVYVLAQSMGNIVTGEALRYAGTNQLVNTYVASQASVTAHTYDDTLPDNLFSSSSPATPNIYKDWFASNNGGGASRVISFYNTNDYALVFPRWELDQWLKPDNALTVFPGIYLFAGYPNNGDAHYTPGSVDDTPPWVHFGKDTFSGRSYFNMNLTADRYEVSAYAAQARTRALGRTAGVGNLTTSLNLGTIWPPDLNNLTSPYSEHFWHSAEFRGDCWEEWKYWNTLLFSSQFGFNINNP